MARGRLRQRCEARVRELDLPTPFDVAELCQRIGRDRGRTVLLMPMSLPGGSPCGLWVSTDAADFIVYEERTSQLHQEHIILHELGHLLCRHEAAPMAGAEVTQLLLPDLDPAMVQRVLGRTHYTAEEEREAEMIATLILQRVSRWTPRPARAQEPGSAGIVARIEHSLEPPDLRGGRE